MEKLVKVYLEVIEGRSLSIIEILGNPFTEHDKRGFSTNAIITLDFAKEIIKNIPCETSAFNGDIYYPERLRSKELKLSWETFAAYGRVVLKIHDSGELVYTSENIIV